MTGVSSLCEAAVRLIQHLQYETNDIKLGVIKDTRTVFSDSLLLLCDVSGINQGTLSLITGRAFCLWKQEDLDGTLSYLGQINFLDFLLFNLAKYRHFIAVSPLAWFPVGQRPIKMAPPFSPVAMNWASFQLHAGPGKWMNTISPSGALGFASLGKEDAKVTWERERKRERERERETDRQTDRHREEQNIRMY